MLRVHHTFLPRTLGLVLFCGLGHAALAMDQAGLPPRKTQPNVTKAWRHSPATTHHLEMEPQKLAVSQHRPNWCWAATLEMLAKSQGIDLPQEFLAERIYGRKRSSLPCGSFEMMQRAVDGVTVDVDGATLRLHGAFHYGVPANPAGMIQAIQDQRPFIFVYAGNCYVCYGITWLEQQHRQRVIELNLIDPLWKLDPARPELTKFNIFCDSLRLINGTFELLVTTSHNRLFSVKSER